MGSGADHGRVSAPYTSARLLPHLMGAGRQREASAVVWRHAVPQTQAFGSVSMWLALALCCTIVVPSFLSTNFVCFNLMESVEQ
jgi:hypothetical protein